MKIALVFCLWLVFGSAYSQAFFPFEHLEQEQLFLKLTHQLRCVVCQNQMLSDSDVPLALDLRRELFERIRAGETERDIIDELQDRYGPQISFSPPLTSKTVFLWASPFVMACLTGYALHRFVQWS